MLREINLDEISDGKLYSSNDMARTDCKGCDGCSACCHGMGSSIVLDPLDVYRLSINLSKPVNELLAGPLELNVADGIILPNLKMTGTKEACSFLDADGRCTVMHSVPESAACSLWDVFMKTILSNISYRYMNVRKRIVLK